VVHDEGDVLRKVRVDDETERDAEGRVREGFPFETALEEERAGGVNGGQRQQEWESVV
jgi:hypothetical protein